MENILRGKLYIAGVTPGFTTPTALVAGEMTILESAAKTGGEHAELMGELSITPKAGETTPDSDLNEVVNSEKVTIEANLMIDSKLYDSFLAKYQGKVCEVRVIDEDSDRMGQIIGIKPYFAPTMKTAKAIFCTMTATYSQGANLSQDKKRYKLVKLTTA
jgi:hypothetical protein